METNIMTFEEINRRISELESWRSIRWNNDDLYKKMPRFGEPNLVEPDIVDIIPELTKPGMTVFDVGAQAGLVTYELSKQVGPRGLVVSFEASPRTARKFLTNTVDAGLRNVEIINKAVWKETGQQIKIFQHETQLNDSVKFSKNSSFSEDRFDLVETISLDNFCKTFHIWPKFIKFDIEGAEYEALMGSQYLIDRSRPAIILEKSDHDGSCYSILKKFGYQCFDLIYLHELSLDDYKSSKKYNFLFLPRESKLPLNSHNSDFGAYNVDFEIVGDKNILISSSILVNRSKRMIFKINANEFLDLKDSNIVFGLINSRNLIIKRYIGRLHSILESYSEIVFTPKFDDSIQIFIQFADNVSKISDRFKMSIISLNNY